MDTLHLEKDEHIQNTISQSLSYEIVPIILVLLLPFSMIFFSNSPIGVFVGITFLLFIIFGIFTIYTKLFNKKILLTNKSIIIKEKQSLKKFIYTKYHLKTIQNLKFEQTLLNRFCDIGILILEVNGNEVRINNISIKDKESIYKQR